MNGDRNNGEDTQVSLTPTAAALMRLMPQEETGHRYEVGRVVKRGGMGEILEARQTGIRRTVAMKVILGEASEEAMARFIEEARITGQLEHPNIVPVHEIGVDEEQRLFYTMKFVNGVTLHEAVSRLRKREPEALRRFTLPELLKIFQKVCDAVAFAHSKDVIHRDLKPANVMLGDFGEALVVDWGLAKRLLNSGEGQAVEREAAPGGLATRTLNGSVMGTPAFMSPEQAMGDAARIDKRSDIYSLGAILHMLLYLRAPIAGKDLDEILANVQAGRIEPPVHNLPHLPHGRVPESLQAVAYKATALEPDKRYQTVADLQADVTSYQNGFATTAEKASLWKKGHLAIRRYRSEAMLTSFALAGLTVLAILSFLKVTRERNRAEEALADLQGAAPAFLSQARSYALSERFPEAQERLDFALKLRPKDPEYLLAKANLLQACLEFEKAAHVYRAVEEGALKAIAHTNAALSDRLALEIQQSTHLSKQSLAELFAHMVKEQRPASELMPLARLLGRERELAVEYWVQRLRQLPFALDPPIEKRIVARPDGTLSVDLRATAIADLTPLSGMPLSELNIAHCVGLSDLSPLRDAPLVSLDISDTGVTDLSPLQSLALRSLSIRGCAVAGIDPLKGQPLLFFDASNTEVTDFSPLSESRLDTLLLENSKVCDLSFLRGSPLRVLRLDNAPNARGFSVLSALSSLETVILPQSWIQLPPDDIASIRGLSTHPNLKRLSARAMQGRRIETAGTADEFWREWRSDLVWIEGLLRTGARPKLMKLPDQTWQIDLHDGLTDDISVLRGAPVSHLDISTTLIKDLSPLAGAPLTYLDLRNTPVKSLEPLRGMRLRTLYLHKTAVRDFSPLSTLRELELLDVSVTLFSDLSILKSPLLTEVRIGSTKVTDLSPLAGLPVRKLHCDSVDVKSLSPLLKVPALEWLIPPRNVSDVILLRSLPNLKLISYDWHQGSEPTMSTEQFWQSPEVLRLQKAADNR